MSEATSGEFNVRNSTQHIVDLNKHLKSVGQTEPCINV